MDFTCNKKNLGVLWSGFEHPRFNVIFHVCIGSKKEQCDINTGVTRNSSYSFHVFKDLELKALQVPTLFATGQFNISFLLLNIEAITII